MLERQRKLISVVSLCRSEAADVRGCRVLWLQGFGQFGLHPGFVTGFITGFRCDWEPVALKTLSAFWDCVGTGGFGILPMVIAGTWLQLLPLHLLFMKWKSVLLPPLYPSRKAFKAVTLFFNYFSVQPLAKS